MIHNWTTKPWSSWPTKITTVHTKKTAIIHTWTAEVWMAQSFIESTEVGRQNLKHMFTW